MSDDFAANTSTTGTVAVGGSATGEIERRRDIDWFSVELVAGKTYVVDLKGSGDDPLVRARLAGLYDSDGAGVSGVTGVGDGAGGSRLTFTATESGTYYIAAGGKGNRQGTYTVEVQEAPDPAPQPDPVQGQPQQIVPPVDPDATAAGATELGDLTSGARVARGSVDGGDDRTDYYKFTLTEARAVTLSLRRQDADADLYLEDGDGNVLASSTRGGTRGETIAETLEAGTYYVRVAAQEAGDNDYTLRAAAPTPARQPQQPLPQLPADPDATAAGATDLGDISIGSPDRVSATEADVDYHRGTVNGTSDVTDYYSFTLSGARHVKFWLTQQDANADLYLEDAKGNVLDSSTKGGKKADIVSAALEAGTYYVRVAAQEAGVNNYVLGQDEFLWLPELAQDASTAGTVDVGGSVVSELTGPNDRDWFKVELEAGKTYRIDLKGTATGDGSLWDPDLNALYDANGTWVRDGNDVWYNDDGGVGTNARGFFTPAEDGTYFIEAAGSPNAPGSARVGTYKLEVAEVDDDYTADTGTTGTISLGSPTTGTIEHPDDIDWFQIELKAGKIYQLDMTGSASGYVGSADVGKGTLADPRLHGVYDAEGNAVAIGTGAGGRTWDDDGPVGNNARVFISPTEDGTYYVAASAGDSPRDRYKTGEYTLSAVEVVDDFAADTSTTGTVAVGGSVWGEVQYWGDRDWVKVELEAGETYRIELLGSRKLNGWSEESQDSSGPRATLWDWNLRGAIYDADGNRVDDSKLGWGGLDGRAHWPPGCKEAWVNRVEFTPTESGTYYVEADTGNYRYIGKGVDKEANADGPAPDDALGTYMVTVAESEFIATDEYSL